MAMNPRPPACRGCPLDANPKTQGFVPPSGPGASPLLFMGEAAGEEEARSGLPFVGAAGGVFNRLLARSHQSRDAFRVGNCLSCRPPNNWLEGAPWQHGALQHCRVHRESLLAEGHSVVMALGGTALKTLLGFTEKGIRVEDFHGTVTRDPSDHFWVVPSYHPSFLQRGAMNLFGVCSFDLQVALRVAAEGYQQDVVSVVVDPSVAWFTQWVEQVEAAVAHDPLSVGIAEDIETPDKSEGQDEGLLSAEDRSYTITRINFSVHPDEGVTVPYQGPYIPLCQRLFQLSCAHYLWNKEYDDPRLLAAGHTFAGDRYDGMWLAHYLQSDVPRGLGFWAPFYCTWGPWKHLARSNPGFYGGCDGFKTYRTVTGVITDLINLGMWENAERHVHRLHKLALKPAQDLGVKIDRQRLEVFIADLEVKQRRLLHEMQGLVPEEWRPLTPKGGLKRPPEEGAVHTKGRSEKKDGTKKKEAPDPIKQELYAQVACVVAREVQTTVLRCVSCGAADVQKRHRCTIPRSGTAGGGSAELVLTDARVTRYFWREPFNPDSPDQILSYLQHRGHKPGRAKKTGADSTDRATLERLLKETKDPLYHAILDSRAVGKIKGTYGVGTLKRMDKDDRVHATPTFKPSTGRLSYVSPNLTNVVSDREGANTLATGFRHCVVAGPSCRLLEVDFCGIEAVLTGWFCRDLRYLKLASLGVHAAVASHILYRTKKIREPYDHRWLGTWATVDLAAYFKDLKKRFDPEYQRAKRVVHGSAYGLTTHGMSRNFPETFPTVKSAAEVQRIYFDLAPLVPKWQQHVQERAYAQNYLGGPGDHPYGYKHWLWSVLGFRSIPYNVYLKRQRAHEPVTTIQGKYFAITLGEDAKRAISFYPQSTAAGVLKEAMLRLFDPDSPAYIGDAYFGQTPLRAPIHDSLLLEVPDRQWDRVLEAVCTEMQRPIPELPLAWGSVEERQQLGLGDYLSIGVEAKAGMDWGTMETVSVPALGVSGDRTTFPVEDDEENQEDFDALGTSVA